MPLELDRFKRLNIATNDALLNEPLPQTKQVNTQQRLATTASNRAMSFDDSQIPKYVSGYTGHVPGRRFIYGRQPSFDNVIESRRQSSRSTRHEYTESQSVDESPQSRNLIGSSGGEFALANNVPTSYYHRHSRPRAPSAHMRRFRSVDSLRDVAVQSDANESVLEALVEDDRRFKNASANIPDAPPTPPDKMSTTANEHETDSGISNGPPRETSSNSRSSNYSRYLRNHSSRPTPMYMSSIPAAGYTGYVPGWKTIVGKSFSSSLQQLKQREMAKLEKLDELRRSSRPASRYGSGARYRSNSEQN